MRGGMAGSPWSPPRFTLSSEWMSSCISVKCWSMWLVWATDVILSKAGTQAIPSDKISIVWIGKRSQRWSLSNVLIPGTGKLRPKEKRKICLQLPGFWDVCFTIRTNQEYWLKCWLLGAIPDLWGRCFGNGPRNLHFRKLSRWFLDSSSLRSTGLRIQNWFVISCAVGFLSLDSRLSLWHWRTVGDGDCGESQNQEGEWRAKKGDVLFLILSAVWVGLVAFFQTRC